MFRQSPAAFAIVFAVVGCDAHPSKPSSGPVKLIPARISLTPLDGHLNRADSLEFHARVLTDQSVEITDAVIQWSSDDAGVAMVNANGVVYGLRQGATRINARVGSLFAQVPVVVADPFKDTPAFLGLDVPQVMLPGELGLLTGRVYNRFRERLVDSLVTWTSADTTIALTSATGQVRAIRPGTAIMRARSGALSDSVSLLVVGPLPIRLDGTRVRSRVSSTHAGRAAEPSWDDDRFTWRDLVQQRCFNRHSRSTRSRDRARPPGLITARGACASPAWTSWLGRLATCFERFMVISADARGMGSSAADRASDGRDAALRG